MMCLNALVFIKIPRTSIYSNGQLQKRFKFRPCRTKIKGEIVRLVSFPLVVGQGNVPVAKVNIAVLYLVLKRSYFIDALKTATSHYISEQVLFTFPYVGQPLKSSLRALYVTSLFSRVCCSLKRSILP